MIKINNIRKAFGGIIALDNCNLEIKEGKITAIIGPNGSGKTTLFNILSRLEKADSGEILFDGKNITNLKDFQIAKLGFSRTFQDVRLFRNLTVKDHIDIALSNEYEFLFDSLFKKKKDKEKRLKEILRIVGLEKYNDTIVSELSYGQRKLADLAMAIAKKHKIILLDEPVAGVNPILRNEIKIILKELRKRGETIAVIEHDMNFVMDITDFVYVLDYGKVIESGTPRMIQKSRKVLEAYIGK